jgi:hypothetical protein
MEQRELREFEKVDSVSLTAPACRMVVIFVAVKRGSNDPVEVDVFVEPVVALRAVAKRYFLQGRNHPYTAPARDDAAAREGCRMVYNCVGMEPVICHSEFGLIGANELLEDWTDTVCRVVPCLWPPDQDDERLSDPIEETKQQAVYVYQLRRAAAAKEKTPA